MTDVIDYLLTSNIVPSPREESAVQQTLTTINNDLVVIENEAEEARAILASVEERRNLVEKERKAYLNILSPIRRLPLEIIGHFLLLSLPEKMDRKDQIQALQRYNVCRTWRQAALITPHLWSVLEIDIGTKRKLSKKLKKGISGCIMRSGSLPLTLAFSSASDNRRILPRLVDWLPDKRRWKKVSIRVRELKDLPFFASLFSSHVWELLECIELQVYRWCDNDQAHPIALHNVRNLKKLILRIPSPATVSALIPLTPSSQLHELHIHKGISIIESLTILNECQNLQICTLLVGYDLDEYEIMQNLPISPPILLPHLHHLNLTIDNGVHQFLLSLKLPNLNEFIFSCDNISGDYESCSDIAEFIRTSRCPIRKMTFECIFDKFGDDDNIAMLLVEMPALVELRFILGSDYVGISGVFFLKREVREALRNLEVIVVAELYPEECTFSLSYNLREFAEYCYCQEIVNLKRIVFEISREEWENEFPENRLYDRQELMNKGLTVEFNYT